MEIALITGGAQGIGAEICRQLSKMGYFIILNYFKSEEKAKEVISQIKNEGGYAEKYCCDIRNKKDIQEMVKYIIQKYNRIDLLVNNAGISEHKLFQDITEEDYRNMIDTNLTGAFFLSQSVVENMISRKRGKIVNISSIWGLSGASMEVHYSIAKAGIIALTKGLAQELAPSNIQVNCVAPGAINTRMMQGFTIEELETFCETIPMGRLGTITEVANCVSFLASDKASYLTGQIISPNGGFIM